jgi:enterochelin esterase-like enzyme
MPTVRRLRSYLRWLLAVPLLAPLGACRKGSEERAPSWANREGGGDFGRRVRAGQVEDVAHHVFRSAAIGQDVGLVVATPRDYRARTSDRYPVVYMFPGIGGDEWSYLLELQGEGPTLKALFADERNAPLVVFCNPGSSGAHGPADRVLGDELVEFVDTTYRTRRSAGARSLEGFSLGGVTALMLLLQHPDRFGRAVAGSSACYLLSSCGAIREQLRARAQPTLAGRVLLSIGAREAAQNGEVNLELARSLGIEVTRIPGADHNWGAQLKTRLGTREFGQLLADFHLRGFAADERRTQPTE